MKKIEGFDYLYRRGCRFHVRMQVPAALRTAVGKSELKRSLGAACDSVAVAARRSHAVIAEFDAILSAARGNRTNPTPSGTGDLTRNEIDRAVYDHFRRMAVQMRGASVSGEPEPSADLKDHHSRLGRVRGYEQHISRMLDDVDGSRFYTMEMSAEWLCEEHGWTIGRGDALFQYLCERMLRARLACYQAEVSYLRHGFKSADGIDPFFGAAPPAPVERPRCLGDLIDKFNKERSGAWSVSTAKNYVIITRVIEEVCGRDTPLASIDKDFCRGIRDVLKQLPSNYQKKAATKGRSITEVIEIASARQMPLLQPATINAHLNKFGAIVRFGRDEGWVLGNPMAEIEVDDPIDALEKRDPFNVAQLNAIFSSEPWASRNDRPVGRPSRFWVPLIALFSGARLGEICGLRTDEIVERDGTPLVHIRHRPDRHVKGGRSRFVPVHPALISLGFLGFVEQQREHGAKMLFPEDKSNSLEHWGDAVSDWFVRLVKRLKLDGRKLTLHSFRHTFEDALREADLHDTPIGNAITGRRSGSVSANYGSSFSTARLSEAVQRVQYPGLSLEHLIRVDAEAE